MTISEQLSKLKENWLLILLVVVLIIMFSGGGNIVSNFSSSNSIGGGIMERISAPSAMGSYDMAKSSMMPIYNDNFAPEVTQRKITRSSSLSSEIERGKFSDAEASLKSIVTSADGYLLYENTNKNGEDSKAYYSGYYNIKVDTKKYDAVLNQLKGIGKVTSFNQNADDVTAQYTNIETELQVEKDRLVRYQKMLNDATLMADKITLSDSIFNEERTIKYLEDSLKNVDNTITYSTISVSLTEKQSDYASIVFVKLSALVATIVGSLATLLVFLFWIAPWAVLYIIVMAIYHKFFATKRRY